MSSQENGHELLEKLNQMLPPKCQGCLTGVASLIYFAGLNDVIGEESAVKALDEIDSMCEGYIGEPVDLRDYVDEDGRTNIPLLSLLVNPDCPNAQRSKAWCDEQWDRMTH